MHDLDDQHFVSPPVVNILIVIHWLPRNYGDVNKPLLRAPPSGSFRFSTAIIPPQLSKNF